MIHNELYSIIFNSLICELWYNCTLEVYRLNSIVTILLDEWLWWNRVDESIWWIYDNRKREFLFHCTLFFSNKSMCTHCVLNAVGYSIEYYSTQGVDLNWILHSTEDKIVDTEGEERMSQFYLRKFNICKCCNLL